MTRLYIAGGTDSLKVGDTILKDDDPDTACLFAFRSVDEAFLAGGYGSAIYGVDGISCGHRSGAGYLFSVMVPNGGYVRGHVDLYDPEDERSGPFYQYFPKETIKRFDTLEVTEVLQAEVFGANGAQVVHALKWYRSKFALQGSRICPIPSMDAAFTRMWKHYDDRIGKYGFWTNFGVTNYTAKVNAAKPTAKAWLQPWKTAEALNECHLAATKTRRAVPCEWLAMASVGMSALAVRDSISHGAFTELWRGIEDIIPIAELDRQVAPVLH